MQWHSKVHVAMHSFWICRLLTLDFCGIYLDEIVLTVFLSAVHFREELQHLFMAALAEGKFQKAHPYPTAQGNIFTCPLALQLILGFDWRTTQCNLQLVFHIQFSGLTRLPMLQCLGLITPHPVLDNLGCPRHQLALDLRLEGRKNQPPAVQKESLSRQRPHFSCFSFLWGFHVVAILRFGFLAIYVLRLRVPMLTESLEPLTTLPTQCKV